MSSTGPTLPPPPPPPPPSSPPPPPPGAPVPPGAPPPQDRRNPYRTALLVLLGLILLIAAVGGGLWLGRRSSSSTTTGPSIGGTTASTGSDIVTVPINTAEDPFTPAAGTDVAVTPVAVASPTLVEGGKVGLYGGTTKATVCDQAQMVSYLTSSPEKAAAWAGVIGITAAQIPDFIRGLTPMLLRSDTLVTNHGFVDGRATSFLSVLQAGNAVLVDNRGNPVVRCFCGNPLTPAPTSVRSPTYAGPTWPEWNPVSVVVIITNKVVIEDFTVVDVDTGAATTVPAGTTTAPGDSPAPSTSATTTTATPASTARPAGEEEKVFAIESIAGVSNKPTKASTFTIEQGLFVTKIGTYHYLNGGIPPGTIGLRSADGTMYGPWPTTGTEGQGGVANAYWTATPEVMLPPGTYTVVDSSPATWSWAPDTGGRGIVAVYGIWEVQGP